MLNTGHRFQLLPAWIKPPLLFVTIFLCAAELFAQGAAPAPLDNSTLGDAYWLDAIFTQQPLLLALVIIASGMVLGALRWGAVTLGASGVLFTALLAGYWGRVYVWELPAGLGSLGLVLFVYSIGLDAGPTFFRTFRDQGKRLAVLALAAGGSATLAAVVAAWSLAIPADLAAGVFAGSASAIETAQTSGQDPQNASIGYGLAYPFGVIVTLVFVQLLPRWLVADLDQVAGQLKSKEKANQIGRHLVEIANPAVFGRKIHDIHFLDQTSGQITRVLAGERLVPIRSDHVFEQGQVVMVVADDTNAEMFTMILGRPSDVSVVMDADHDRMDIVVTSPQMLDKPLSELHLRTAYGVTISRIERYGVSFVPSAKTTLAMGDRLTAVGPPDGLTEFLAAAGHRVRKLHETDLVSLGVGLSIGIVIGMIPITIPGVGSIMLGLAGGPLLAGLLLGHFGRFLGVVGYMPLAARMLTQQLGLAFFLAEAGFAAGGQLVPTLESQGAAPFIMSLVVAVVPLAVTYAVARFALGMNLLEILGGACGAMTSTAGIGAITSKTDSEVPVTSYAAAYPVALVLMTISARLIVMLAG